MGDVISIRARKEGDTIHYRVVDEYQDECGPFYELEPTTSSRPLTLAEVKDLLWSIEVESYGHLFMQGWREQLDGDIADYENDFYFIRSEFYDGLQAWLEESFEEWKAWEAKRFHPGDKVVCLNDDFRVSIFGKPEDQFDTPQGNPRKGQVYCVRNAYSGEQGTQGLLLVGLSTFVDGREIGFNSTRFRKV